MNRLAAFFRQALHAFDNVIFSSPRVTLGVILLITLFFAAQIPGVRMYSDFADLLPQGHTYIKLHNQIRDNFGGANNIIVGVEVEEGNIFSNERLSYIHRLTQAIDSLPGVNHNLVGSLTHRNTRRVWLSETGGINSESHYDPMNREMSGEDLARMMSEVATNPRVFGLLVSTDFKAALIKATFNEGQLDYERIFQQVQQLRQEDVLEGVRIHVSGQPMMVGWIYSYVDQILQVFLFTAVVLIALLVLYFRRLLGILLPLAGILLSSIWGLGIISLLGFNLDPLTLVVPFLISARAMSHGVQLVQRYYQELSVIGQTRVAARNTFDSLFRPGTLGVTSDAIGLLLIALSSVPINVKLAYYASLWAFGVIFTVLVFIPVALTVLPQPWITRHPTEKTGRRFQGLANAIWSPSGSRRILGGAALLLVAGVYLSSWVQIGEAEPGTPLLYPEHDYNVSSKAINTLFPGSEELYVIARTDEKGGIKRPEVLRALESLQAHMLNDPELGGAKGVPDLVKQVNRILHNDDPRWMQIPEESNYVGGLLFSYMASSPVPGALKEFIDTDEREANLVFYYKDHKGETIRRAIHMVKEWMALHGDRVEGLSIHLAGGGIGVTAAINEASYRTNMLIIPLVLGLIFVFVTAFYWSWHAGGLMMLAMSFATALTYAYMGLKDIGINVNTVPIIAVGIGVGIDYSIYIMDRIREEVSKSAAIVPAVRKAIQTTGVAIAFTAASLISGVIMWVFLSDLRFQADAALLLCVMLALNAVAAIFVVPAWIMLFKPAFITQARLDENGILVRVETEGVGGKGS
jgi:predicted RND superfamily exporter protein